MFKEVMCAPNREAFIHKLGKYGVVCSVRETLLHRRQLHIIVGVITDLKSLFNPNLPTFYMLEILPNGSGGTEIPVFMGNMLSQQVKDFNLQAGDLIALNAFIIKKLKPLQQPEVHTLEVHVTNENAHVWCLKISSNPTLQYESRSIYIYKTISELVEEQIVNVFGVISDIQYPVELNSNECHAVIAIKDETCVSGQTFRIHIVTSLNRRNCTLVKNAVVRLHHVKIEKFQNSYHGRVFFSKDVVTFVHKENNSFDVFTTASKYTITYDDEERAMDLMSWNITQYCTNNIACDISLSDIMDEGHYNVVCTIICINVVTNKTAVLTVTDATNFSPHQFQATSEEKRYNFDIFISNLTKELRYLKESQIVKLYNVTAKHYREAESSRGPRQNVLLRLYLDGRDTKLQLFPSKPDAAINMAKRLKVSNVSSNASTSFKVTRKQRWQSESTETSSEINTSPETIKNSRKCKVLQYPTLSQSEELSSKMETHSRVNVVRSGEKYLSNSNYLSQIHHDEYIARETVNISSDEDSVVESETQNNVLVLRNNLKEVNNPSTAGCSSLTRFDSVKQQDKHSAVSHKTFLEAEMQMKPITRKNFRSHSREKSHQSITDDSAKEHERNLRNQRARKFQAETSDDSEGELNRSLLHLESQEDCSDVEINGRFAVEKDDLRKTMIKKSNFSVPQNYRSGSKVDTCRRTSDSQEYSSEDDTYTSTVVAKKNCRKVKNSTASKSQRCASDNVALLNSVNVTREKDPALNIDSVNDLDRHARLPRFRESANSDRQTHNSTSHKRSISRKEINSSAQSFLPSTDESVKETEELGRAAYSPEPSSSYAFQSQFGASLVAEFSKSFGETEQYSNIAGTSNAQSFVLPRIELQLDPCLTNKLNLNSKPNRNAESTTTIQTDRKVAGTLLHKVSRNMGLTGTTQLKVRNNDQSPIASNLKVPKYQSSHKRQKVDSDTSSVVSTENIQLEHSSGSKSKNTFPLSTFDITAAQMKSRGTSAETIVSNSFKPREVEHNLDIQESDFPKQKDHIHSNVHSTPDSVKVLARQNTNVPLASTSKASLCRMKSNDFSKSPKNSLYTYKTISELVREEKFANVYGILNSISKPCTERDTKFHGIVNIVDETCKTGQSFKVHIYFQKDTESPTLIEHAVMRFHRMKIESYEGKFDGRVFHSRDVVTFTSNEDGSLRTFSTAKNQITFTHSDNKRIQELIKWSESQKLSTVNQQNKVTYDVLLSDITDKGYYNITCRVVSHHKLTDNTAVLTVTDGSKCPTNLKRANGNRETRPSTLEQASNEVDIFITYLTEELEKLKNGQHIKISNLEVKECESEVNDNASPSLLELSLNGKEAKIYVFPNDSNVARKISKRLKNETRTAQDNDESLNVLKELLDKPARLSLLDTD